MKGKKMREENDRKMKEKESKIPKECSFKPSIQPSKRKDSSG